MISTMNPIRPRNLPPAINTQKLRPVRTPGTPTNNVGPVSTCCSPHGQASGPQGGSGVPQTCPHHQASSQAFALDPSWLQPPLSAGTESLLTPTSASFSSPPTSASPGVDSANAFPLLCAANFQVDSAPPVTASVATSTALCTSAATPELPGAPQQPQQQQQPQQMSLDMTMATGQCTWAPGPASAGLDQHAALSSPGIASDISNLQMEMLAKLTTGDVPATPASSHPDPQPSLATPATTSGNLSVQPSQQQSAADALRIDLSASNQQSVPPPDQKDLGTLSEDLPDVLSAPPQPQATQFTGIPSPQPDDKSWLNMGNLVSLTGTPNFDPLNAVTNTTPTPPAGAAPPPCSPQPLQGPTHKVPPPAIVTTTTTQAQLPPTPGSTTPSSAIGAHTRPRAYSGLSKRLPLPMMSPVHHGSAVSQPTTPIDAPPDALRFLDMRGTASQGHSPQFQTRTASQQPSAVSITAAAASAMAAENILNGATVPLQEPGLQVNVNRQNQVGAATPMPQQVPQVPQARQQPPRPTPQVQQVQSVQPVQPVPQVKQMNTPSPVPVQGPTPKALHVQTTPAPRAPVSGLFSPHSMTLSPSTAPSVSGSPASAAPPHPLPVSNQGPTPFPSAVAMGNACPTGPMQVPAPATAPSIPATQAHSYQLAMQRNAFAHGHTVPTARSSMYMGHSIPSLSAPTHLQFPSAGYHPYAQPVTYARGLSGQRPAHRPPYPPLLSMYNQYSASTPYMPYPYPHHAHPRYSSPFCAPPPGDLFPWNLPRPDEPPPHPDEFNERGDDPPKKAKNAAAAASNSNGKASGAKQDATGKASSGGTDFSSQGSRMSRYIPPSEAASQVSEVMKHVPSVTA